MLLVFALRCAMLEIKLKPDRCNLCTQREPQFNNLWNSDMHHSGSNYVAAMHGYAPQATIRQQY